MLMKKVGAKIRWSYTAIKDMECLLSVRIKVVHIYIFTTYGILES